MSEKESLFLALIRAGIDGEVKEEFPALTEVQTAGLLQLAMEQTMVGITMDGLQKLMPSGIGNNSQIIRWYGLTEMIAGMNDHTNNVAGDIYAKLAGAGFRPVMVKGQVVAQEYPNPLRRVPGDVDLYFEPSEGRKAVATMEEWGYCIKEKMARDISFDCDGVTVEIHPYIAHSLFDMKDEYAERFQKWCEEEMTQHCRTMKMGNKNVEVRIPSVMMSIIYEFYHMWAHFVRGGIGLRQVCDWRMCLHNYYGQYDVKELHSKLEYFGLMRPWSGFSGILVDYLGLPAEEMPFYKQSSKTERILSLIFDEGNFGKNHQHKPLPTATIPRICAKTNETLARYWKVGRLFPRDFMHFLPGPGALKRYLPI